MIEDIVQMAKEVLEVGDVIGKGGFGIVLVVGNNEKQVVKINHSPIECKQLDFEYQLQLSAYGAFNKYTTQEEKIRIGGIPQPQSFDIFKNTLTTCYMTMDRVFPPYSSHSQETQIYQLWLGEETDLFIRDPDRGVIIGADALSGLGVDPHQITSDMGILAAILHYGSKQTALDVEYVIGRKYNEFQNKVFAFDFNQSSFWNDDIELDRLINMLVESLEIPAMAPDITETPKLWESFRTAYLQKATEIGYLPQARLVMHKLEQNQTG